MRKIILPALERGRIRNGYYASTGSAGLMGAFSITVMGTSLVVLSSGPVDGVEVVWEHVSVSAKERCPSWDEMCAVKALFWDAEECVVQFHPPMSKYVNVHPHCLHLWKTPYEITLPPGELLG